MSRLGEGQVLHPQKDRFNDNIALPRLSYRQVRSEVAGDAVRPPNPGLRFDCKRANDRHPTTVVNAQWPS
jgi:hypothetical protein